MMWPVKASPNKTNGSLSLSFKERSLSFRSYTEKAEARTTLTTARASFEEVTSRFCNHLKNASLHNRRALLRRPLGFLA